MQFSFFFQLYWMCKFTGIIQSLILQQQMTLNIRLISINLINGTQFLNDSQFYLCVKDPQKQVLYKTNIIRNAITIQWNYQQCFRTKPEIFYQFQFYKSDRINKDIRVGYGRFYLSQIEEAYKSIIRTISLKQSNGEQIYEAGSLIIQVQYNQGQVILGQILPMQKEIALMSKKNKRIQKQKQSDTATVPIMSTMIIPNDKQSKSISDHQRNLNKKFNIFTYFDAHPTVNSQFTMIPQNQNNTE